jgi:hypothetical protein
MPADERELLGRARRLRDRRRGSDQHANQSGAERERSSGGPGFRQHQPLHSNDDPRGSAEGRW